MWCRGIVVLSILLLASESGAGLQNVEINGMTKIRYRGYYNTYAKGVQPLRLNREVRVPADLLPRRAIGDARGLTSIFTWNEDESPGRDFAEQFMRLGVTADFTGNVSAVAEVADYHIYSQDFRSDYITGQDRRQLGINEEEFLHAYIEVDELFGQPLRLRIGRQQIKWGRGWLIGTSTTSTQEFSFDAVRLTYNPGPWDIDVIWSRLSNRLSLEEDGEQDLYGINFTYRDWAPAELSLYYLLVDDGQAANDNVRDLVGERFEDFLGLDQYPTGELHTVGALVMGSTGNWDYFIEGAYQWGEAARLGELFKIATPFGVYGDDDAEYDELGLDAEVGYTFSDVAWSPRLFVGGTYFSGDDNRDISFLEYINPFFTPEASTAFNRLFSMTYYAPVIIDNTHMSNFSELRAGVVFAPHEKWWVRLRAAEFWANGTFEWPLSVQIRDRRIPVAPMLPFLTEESDDNLGTTVEALVKYNYTEDLLFTLYFGYLFTEDGLGRDGNFVFNNGTTFSGGTASDDAIYWTFMITLGF